MGKLQSVIDEFENLNLGTCSIEDVQALLLEVGVIPAIVQGLHEGAVIYRARTLEENEKITKMKDLSYNPIASNSFQRASIPNQTMFYGISELYNSTHGAVLAMQETCPFFKEGVPIEDGTYRIAVSQWCVLDTIALLVLLHPDTTNKSARLNEMVKSLYNFIQEYQDKWDAEDIIAFQKFMCGQFTKHVENNDNDKYKISASFAQRVTEEEELDGVIWESSWINDAQLKETLCVAIKPKTVDTLMRCEWYQLYTFTFKDNKQISCKQEIYSVSDFSTPIQSKENNYPIQSINTKIDNTGSFPISKSSTSHNPTINFVPAKKIKKKKKRKRKTVKRKKNIVRKRKKVGKGFLKKRRVRKRNRRKDK